jgi:hypothetical protein
VGLSLLRARTKLIRLLPSLEWRQLMISGWAAFLEIAWSISRWGINDRRWDLGWTTPNGTTDYNRVYTLDVFKLGSDSWLTITHECQMQIAITIRDWIACPTDDVQFHSSNLQSRDILPMNHPGIDYPRLASESPMTYLSVGTEI